MIVGPTACRDYIIHENRRLGKNLVGTFYHILNVGGFSDAVFSVVAAFLADDNSRFVAEVEKVEL